LDSYDNNELVTYIDDNLNQTKQIILEKLQPEFNEIPGWFSYEHLYNEMVENGTDGDVFVELGAWLGKSTNHMATLIKDSNKDIKFTTVDTWKGTDGEEIHDTIVGGFGGDIFSEFMENTMLSNNSKLFNVIKDTSENASNQFQHNSIDFIMLDAGHTYDSLKSDLNFWYHKVKPGGVISGDDYGGSFFPGVTRAADEFFYNQAKHVYRSFVRKKPKIQIKHLMTKPNDLREQISSESLKQLESYGMVYQPIVNTPFDGTPPSDFCKRPNQISDKPGNFGNGLGPLTGRHYGCFNAHRGALEAMDDEFDYTLVFEADAFIFTGLKEFVEAVHKACFISERDDVYFIGLSNNNSRSKEYIDDLFSKTASNQDLAHAYLIPNRTKSWWIDRFNDTLWEGYDLWLTDVFNKESKLRYTTNKMYVKQADGFSLIDREVKKWN
jgi:GR25 family glycosyltransferase involved in LPS biosynthesis